MSSLALGDTGRRSETHAPDTETLTSPEKPVDGGVTVSQCLRASRAPIGNPPSLALFQCFPSLSTP
jgi:hypothetical protein